MPEAATSSYVTRVACAVAESIGTPGLTIALADSRTLKSLTLQTHQSKCITLGTIDSFSARKRPRSVIAGAYSYFVP